MAHSSQKLCCYSHLHNLQAYWPTRNSPYPGILYWYFSLESQPLESCTFLGFLHLVRSVSSLSLLSLLLWHDMIRYEMRWDVMRWDETWMFQFGRTRCSTHWKQNSIVSRGFCLRTWCQTGTPNTRQTLTAVPYTWLRKEHLKYPSINKSQSVRLLIW